LRWRFSYLSCSVLIWVAARMCIFSLSAAALMMMPRTKFELTDFAGRK
jgi:hypothetical protein